MNKWLLGLCVVAVGTSVALVWVSRDHTPDVSGGKECAVYRSLYNHLAERNKGIVFRSTSRPFKKENYEFAPTDFWRQTEKYKVQKITPGGQQFRWPIWEKFEKDTSGYFKALRGAGGLPIHACFQSQPERPEFYGGWKDWIYVRLNLIRKGYIYGPDFGIFIVSPIGFSEDGRYALLYEEVQCSGRCGGGGFDLFEKRNGIWIWIGYSMVWVA